MKFVVARQQLINLVSKAISVVPNKPAIPILANLLIEATKEGVSITATDLTVGVRCFTAAKVLEEGATTVPAKCFGPLMRELTSANVEIDDQGNDNVKVTSDSSIFKIRGMSHREYPSLPDFAGATQVVVKENVFKDVLFRTAFAVATEDNRPALTGLSMKIQGGNAIFTGTDSRRLARASIPVDVDKSFVGEYILPLKAVNEIIQDLDDSEERDVKVYLVNDKVAVETPEVLFITKLIAGDYPDVDRVIPVESEAVVLLHREELTTLLRQVSLFVNDPRHSVRFTFGDAELKVSANTMDVGEGKVNMPVNYQGPQLDIAFNPTFFLDVLKHSKGENVTIGLTDSFNPAIITDGNLSAKATTAPNPAFVLMPMRLHEE